jgi:taurine dioxygenase
MSAITVTPLTSDLPFGARIGGLDWDTLKDDAVRKQILDVYWERGLLVFEEVEQSQEMQVALSHVFGPLQDHAFKGVDLVDDRLPGVVEFNFEPSDTDIFEVGGRPLINFLPWHFDACYTKELNRGAVLRSLIIPPEGGLTGFADGVQMYQAISPETRARFETLSIVYQAALMQKYQKFGLPKDYRVIRSNDHNDKTIKMNADQPRSIHPAVWHRPSGEKVLHVSPWQAAGIWGHEDPEGDALLEAFCHEMYAAMTPYWHKWKPTDMLVWDNWRFIHGVSGHDPQYPRRMHRTTIKGDYGLGRFEKDAPAGAPVDMMS